MTSPTLIVAPMRGITNRVYRQAFMRHFKGMDLEMAPFIPTVQSERINPKLLKDILPENQSGLPLIPQLIGNNGPDFVHMCHAIQELGYEEVNWNMGCPHKPIRRKQRGSGLLAHPDRVDRLLETICAQSPLKLSIKVRLGVAGPEELMALIPVLNRYPLTEVIIHPRTAEQMYNGTVDLEAFSAAYEQIDQTVCYNGDIYDLAFFRKLQQRFPEIQRFMLGRGLLANPFLAEIIKSGNETIPNAIERIAAFHADICAHYERLLYGDQPVLGKMKEFWTYQTLHLSNGRNMFKKIKKAQRLPTYKAIVNECLLEAKWAPQVVPKQD